MPPATQPSGGRVGPPRYPPAPPSAGGGWGGRRNAKERRERKPDLKLSLYRRLVNFVKGLVRESQRIDWPGRELFLGSLPAPGLFLLLSAVWLHGTSWIFRVC